MYLGYQSINFKSVAMYIYNNWNYEQHTNALSISYLYSLCASCKFGKVCSDLQHIQNDFDIKDLLAPVSNSN